jgi:hypothetical protein
MQKPRAYQLAGAFSSRSCRRICGSRTIPRPALFRRRHFEDDVIVLIMMRGVTNRPKWPKLPAQAPCSTPAHIAAPSVRSWSDDGHPPVQSSSPRDLAASDSSGDTSGRTAMCDAEL